MWPRAWRKKGVEKHGGTSKSHDSDIDLGTGIVERIEISKK